MVIKGKSVKFNENVATQSSEPGNKSFTQIFITKYNEIPCAMQYNKEYVQLHLSEKKEDEEGANFSEKKNYSLDSDEEEDVSSKKLNVDDIDGQEATTMVCLDFMSQIFVL